MRVISYLKESLVRQVWLLSSLIGGGILTSLFLSCYAWWAFSKPAEQASLLIISPHTALILSIFALIGTWFLALATVFLSQSQLSTPLVQLTKILHHYAKQDFNHNVPLTERADELGAIARTIDILKANTLQGIALQEEKEAQRKALSAASTSFQSDANTLFDATDLSSVVDTVQAVNTMGHEVSHKVTHMDQSVKSSSEALTEALARVDELQSAVQSITTITKVLGEMADQTNLLALNASIEAARAGEAGKGFTVVADAVKKLAEETAKQLKTINTHTLDLKTAGEASKNAVLSLNDALANVTTGSAEITQIMQNQQGLMSTADETINAQSASLNNLAQSISQFLNALQASHNQNTPS